MHKYRGISITSLLNLKFHHTVNRLQTYHGITHRFLLHTTF